jgi:hypothetical protein
MMPSPNRDELHDRFYYHAPSPKGVETHTRLSAQFKAMAVLIAEVVPHGREQSLAITKLEEAKFWASAGVARNSESS